MSPMRWAFQERRGLVVKMMPFPHELISILRVEQVSDEKVQVLLTLGSRKPTHYRPYNLFPDCKTKIKMLFYSFKVLSKVNIALYIREKEV